MRQFDVKRILGQVPYMTLAQADTMLAFFRDHSIVDVLELGFCHGASTCYMAVALSELGRGSIVSIDLEQSRGLSPNVESLLERIGERNRVQIFYEPTSYTWRLMKFLEENPEPRFDFCYLDGAHSWFVDGFAFYLVDRLLRPGGWIVFDDVNWTYASSPALKDSDWVRNMPDDEKYTAQVGKVYELLVKPHPQYHNFRTEAGWAYAQKREGCPHDSAPAIRDVVVEQVVRIEKVHVGMGALISRCIKGMKKR